MKRFCLPLWLILSLNCYTQQKRIDSLYRAFKTAKADSALFSRVANLVSYYSETKRDSSLFFLDKALVIAKKNDKVLNEAAVLDSKGYELMHLKKYPESLLCFEEAQKLAEDPANENKFWNIFDISTPHKARLNILASVHHDWGHLMGSTNNIDQQIIQYQQAKKIAGETGNKNLLGLVNMNLGYTYFKLNRLDSSLMLEKSAEKIFKQIGFNKYLGFVYVNIADIYLKRGNKVLGLPYAFGAIRSALEQNNLAAAGYGYEALTRYYLASKQPDSSLFYSTKLLESLHTMGSKDLGEVYEFLYKSYQLKGRADSAYKYQGLTLTAKDSSYKATVKGLTDFQKLSLNYQLRLQALEKEKAAIQTKIRTYVLLVAIGVFMLLAVVFYRNNRQKQKANHLLHAQKQEIEAQRDELEIAFSELKATQGQLVQREKMASLGELTAGIAHEIQNPLNFVNNFSEVNRELLVEMQEEIDKGNLDDAKAIANDVIVNQEKISQHGKRADFIVKGMLLHSRNSSGEKELTNINTMANEFFKLSYQGLRAKDKNFNAELVTHFEKDLPEVNVAHQDIGRVLLNLFNNAFYAVNEKKKTARDNYKPEVSVSTSIENNALVIKVKDNGNGIPDAIKDKIMQPFFTTKPTGEGTGLGLSLSYDIVVKGHGGNIEVKTKEGEHTEFTVVLPMIYARNSKF